MTVWDGIALATGSLIVIGALVIILLLGLVAFELLGSLLRWLFRE